MGAVPASFTTKYVYSSNPVFADPDPHVTVREPGADEAMIVKLKQPLVPAWYPMQWTASVEAHNRRFNAWLDREAENIAEWEARNRMVLAGESIMHMPSLPAFFIGPIERAQRLSASQSLA